MFSGILTTLLVVAVVIGLVIIMASLVRSDKGINVFVGLLCLIWTFTGVYSGFTAYDYFTKYSAMYGTIEEHDPYEDFNFYEYGLSKTIGWSYDAENERYYYQTTYATSIEFNGNENNYSLLINNRPCDYTTSAYGKLYGAQNIYFNDIDGTYKSTINLQVSFTFYASKIMLRIDTSATNENIGLLDEYILVNGLDLRIIKQIYNPYELLTGQPV